MPLPPDAEQNARGVAHSVETTLEYLKRLRQTSGQGKAREEIAARLKEALSQIKHGKSDRPVFAPEFLARLKRVIVFNPLDEGAMHGICRNLVGQMQAEWREKRKKELEVESSLIEYLGAEAHRRNEKAKGKEGGRIVRRLITDLVEAPIQSAMSERTEEYIRAGRVEVGRPDATGESDAWATDVRFG